MPRPKPKGRLELLDDGADSRCRSSRVSITSSPVERNRTLPDSAILVAGAWFTGVLAAICLYVFTSLDARARGFLERAAPLPDPNPAAAEEFVMEYLKSLAFRIVADEPLEGLQGAASRNSQSRP